MPEDEKFLSRWSRLKREAAEAPAVSASTPAPVELPPVDSLGFDSDFTGFLQAKVDEKLKQAALKKLFHSPHFNQMDGLDVYIDDYNTFEPIPESMLRELNHAQDLLFRDPAGEEDEGKSSVHPLNPGREAQVPAPQAEAPLPSIEPTTVDSAAVIRVPSDDRSAMQTDSDNRS